MNKKDLKALWVLTKYTLLSTLRNPSALFFGFLFPFIFIIAFGLISNSGNTKFDLGIYETSEKDNYIYETLKKVEVLNLIEDKNEAELEADLNKGQLSGIINITKNDDNAEPSTFKLDLKTTSASQNSPALRNVVESLVQSINNPPNPSATNVVTLDVEQIEGRKYENIDFILPGQLSFALLSTGVFTVAFSIITLRRTLVLKRIFATPAPKWTILMSKVFSSMIIALLQATVIIAVGHFIFKFTLANGIYTFLTMLALSLIGLLVFLALGLLVASLGNNEDSVSPVANLLTLPQFLLSGAFFPIAAFPEFLQVFAKLLPMTYLNQAMRAVAFEGAQLTDVLPEIGALAIWAIVLYLIVVKMFKWE